MLQSPRARLGHGEIPTWGRQTEIKYPVKEDSETDSLGSTGPFWGVTPMAMRIEIEENSKERPMNSGLIRYTHHDTRPRARTPGAVYLARDWNRI